MVVARLGWEELESQLRLNRVFHYNDSRPSLLATLSIFYVPVEPQVHESDQLHVISPQNTSQTNVCLKSGNSNFTFMLQTMTLKMKVGNHCSKPLNLERTDKQISESQTLPKTGNEHLETISKSATVRRDTKFEPNWAIAGNYHTRFSLASRDEFQHNSTTPELSCVILAVVNTR